ncbi:MAG TPA: NADH-quinone oxidoreductase subunit L [Bdellovibrionota bacterium]|nr:NADH-quinone oxidoreductase subunit L [Bdellovibrionota bacterium]
MYEGAIYLVLFCPLAGFLIQLLAGKYLSEKIAGTVSSLAIFLSLVGSVAIFLQFQNPFTVTLFEWFSVGDLHAPWALYIDKIALLMILVVTGISFLIHVYSIGYMHGDPLFSRYFSFLNLFVFAMLILVMADNLLLMFVGWEGVGLCSYLLIGFWFQDEFKAFCGKKAFIVNRIGDSAFILGIFLIFLLFGNLTFTKLSGIASNFTPETYFGRFNLITLLLFIGAMGKSAQIPLYVWLPDAMAGPTPVSALIHAATMVTAGVYMICRMRFLYNLAPITQNVVIIIGTATALLASLIALTQKDIKKVLAYSTVSQLGYMFLAAGLGAYTAAMFHLTTHAFFKALLFLCAGSVIHACHGEQNMFKMGGLKNMMPITYLSFLVGALALAGIPPFAGFFSKDAILALAYDRHPALWAVAAGTALLTAFYIFRAVALTFHGELKIKEAHESGSLMTFPLVVLAAGSLLVGFLGIPQFIPHTFHIELNHEFSKFLGFLKEVHLSVSTEWTLMAVCSGSALITAWVAHKLFTSKKEVIETCAQKLSILHNLSEQKFYVDEVYDFLIVRPLKGMSQFFWKYFDLLIIDGTVNFMGQLGRNIAALLSIFQTGKVTNYAFVMFLGALVILLYLVRL